VWAAKSFQALEVNRAASLRESVALADVWNTKLPPAYWEVSAQLAAEEARRLPAGKATPTAENLHLKLTEMEALAGTGFRANKVENFRNQSSLSLFQKGLRDSELFLSFSLGGNESYLWAVSGNSLRLYRLAREEEIAKAVQAFRDALPARGPEATRRGRELYQLLFGQLRSSEIAKTAWLLSLEGSLFDLPFAALVAGQRDDNVVYLVEKHSLQTVPAALLSEVSTVLDSGKQTGREFLGVGVAGAQGVISTGWPVEDSSGEIFSRFYHYLPQFRAAEALRLSQLDMIHEGSWRASPAYWASYQLTGASRQ
jgi:CHAT domain-containing protein